MLSAKPRCLLFLFVQLCSCKHLKIKKNWWPRH